MRRRLHALSIGAILAGTIAGCQRHASWGGPEAAAPTATDVAEAPSPSTTATATANAAPIPGAPMKAGEHPRILLTRERLANLEREQTTGAPAWRELAAKCDEVTRETIEAGYEAEDWADAAVDLALCAKAGSGAAKSGGYAGQAVKYLKALVDDHEKVGDGAGGLPAVEEADGYPIRNRGFLAAIAYDWLYDTLSPGDRAHMAGRFDAFCKWYRKDGYKHDDPIANHYMGHFGACGMAGIALDGDDPHGAELHAIARGMWQKEIIPAYARVGGGDFPEGWQYARIPETAIALWVDAESRASGKAIDGELPWLREAIAFQAHAMLPDGGLTWDNADWSHKPAHPFPEGLWASALAIPKGDPASEHALFLARTTTRTSGLTWEWLRAIADDASRAGADPRAGATSYFAPGTGTVFARTDWTKGAVWLGENSGPPFGDHQHLDQGHFEIARGGDALIIDPGDYDSYATMSHNTILVDDAKENLRWTPNQGLWGGAAVKMARYEDAGGFVYTEAEFGAAYNPDGYPEYHKGRSVTRAEREMIFSRAPLASASKGSARVVIYDRVTVTKPTYAVTWAAHGVGPSACDGDVCIAVHTSNARIETLVPPGAKASLLKEPTVHSDEEFTKNDPADGILSTRIEIASPRGALERRFLHVIAIGGPEIAKRDPPSHATRIAGEGVDGASIDGEAYVFPIAGPQKTAARIAYRAPLAATRHVVTGLVPSAAYSITATSANDACAITIAPGGAKTASAQGTLAFEQSGCAVK